jgi:hypothetical protein
MQKLPWSATKRIPAVLKAIAFINPNEAAVPCPSLYSLPPFPANTVLATAPLVAMILTRNSNVVVTYNTPSVENATPRNGVDADWYTVVTDPLLVTFRSAEFP